MTQGLNYYIICGQGIHSEGTKVFFKCCNTNALNIFHFLSLLGTAVAQWLRCCATFRKVAGSIKTVSGFFIDIKSFRSHYGTGVDSTSNRNEYREYFLGVKSGRCVRLTTLPPSCAVVTKSGNPNFLEPSGPLQACNGIALPFFLSLLVIILSP